MKSYSKRYYLKNKDIVNSYHKKYYLKYRDSVISRVKQYCARNRDELAHKRKSMYHSNIEYARVVLKCARKYYAKKKAIIYTNQGRTYNLMVPKPSDKQQYVLIAKKNLLGNAKLMKKFMVCFKSQQENAYKQMSRRIIEQL